MRTVLYHIVFVVFLNVLAPQYCAQEVVVAAFGGSAFDEFTAMTRSSSGGFVLCGTSASGSFLNTDIYVARVDDELSCIWNVLIGGSGIERGTGVVEAADGSIYVSGFTNGFGAGGYDILLARISPQGELEWMRTLGGEDWDFSSAIALAENGDVLICGRTWSSGAGNADGYLARVSPDSDLITEWTFGDVGNDALNDVISVSGGMAICGYYTVNSVRQAFISRLNDDGSVHWSELSSYGFGDCELSSIAFGNDHLYTCGVMQGTTYQQGFFRRLDLDGSQTLWDTALAPGSYSYQDIVPVPGGFFVTGKTRAYGFGENDGLVYSFTDSGGYEGGLFYGTNREDEFHAIVLTDEGFAVCGNRESAANQWQAIAMHYRRSALYSEDIMSPADQGCLTVGIEEEGFPETLDGNYQILDLSGRLICKGFTENLLQINPDLPSGVYVITLPEKGLSRKIMVR